MIKQAVLTFKKAVLNVDWKLLILLLLFLNVKLAVKIPVMIMLYLWRRDFNFGFSIKNSRLPLFYLFIAGIAVVGLIVNKNYQSPHYMVVWLTGIGFWLICILAIHQVKLSVENNSVDDLHRTLFIFFVINILFSFINILAIIWETGALNPYRYQGNYQKYFISTGDYIKGVTFDTSTTNAVINAFGVIYFLVRKQAAMVCVCMLVLLLTGSNFVNMALLLILAGLFIVKSNRDQKSLVIICLGFLIIFMAKVSPQNTNYAEETVARLRHKKAKHVLFIPSYEVPVIQATDSLLSPERKKQKIAMLYLDSIAQHEKAIKATTKTPLPVTIAPELIVNSKPVIPKPSIHSAPFQNRADTTAEQKKLIAFIDTNETKLHLPARLAPTATLPGKVVAMQQTLAFFKHAPQKLLVGDGMGNFSSKLAFRASNLGITGGFPARYSYISNGFLTNHLKVYLNFFSKRAGLHSLTNSPNSVYDQLISEYGLLGLVAFALFYAGYFLKHIRSLTYGIPILLMMGAVFFVDYWFEQLSIVIFFEFLLLLNIKETRTQPAVIYES